MVSSLPETRSWRHAGGATLGLTLVLALVAPPARAQDAARMEAIERQIRSLQGELGRMRRDMQARETETRAAKQEAAQARSEVQAAQRRLDAAPAAAPRLTEAPPADQVRLSLVNNRPTMTTADGRFRASLGAQVQYDVGGAIQGDRTAGAPRLNSFGENLRRGRLFFGFQYDNLLLNVTPEFGGSPDGSPTLYEANLTWAPIRPLALTVGYYKPYYGLADSMSSNDFLFLERPSIMEISRNIVAGDSRSSIGGRWADNRWFAAGYFTGDAYGSNSTQATSGQTGFVGRVAGRPYTDADTDLHVGITGSHAFDLRRQADGQSVRLRDRPEWRAGDPSTRLIDTGSIPADHASTWGPEIGLRWRNFMLQGEYHQINLEQAQSAGALRPDLTFEGGYVEASWVMTGEPRRYSTSSAAFGRPNPAHPFDFRSGSGWGAWELMARYSVADLNDKVTRGRAQTATGGVHGGRQEVVGLGLSWYPTSILRFMLDWNIVNVDRLNAAGTQQIGDRFHTIGLRTQMAF